MNVGDTLAYAWMSLELYPRAGEGYTLSERLYSRQTEASQGLDMS